MSALRFQLSTLSAQCGSGGERDECGAGILYGLPEGNKSFAGMQTAADWTHGSLYPSAGMREQDLNLDPTTAPRWPIVCDAGPTRVRRRGQACFLWESTDYMLLDCICIRVT